MERRDTAVDQGLGWFRKPGAVADVAVFDLKEGSFEFVDNESAKRTGRQKLVPYAVISGGKKI